MTFAFADDFSTHGLTDQGCELSVCDGKICPIGSVEFMIWLDFLIAISCGGAGLACGWVMHAMDGISGEAKTAVTAQSTTAPTNGGENAGLDASDVGDIDNQRELVGEAAARLKSYAYAMAADVDAHQSRVQAVNNSLNENANSSPEAVSEAIHQLIEANEKMQSQLQSAQDRIHEQALQIECAEKRAETDALTRVPNRGAFDRHFMQRWELGSSVPSTLAMIDVDHFKKFNDVYGHRAGDEVLRVVAGMLHSRLNERGIVARFGGEEFAVVLDDCDIHLASQYVEEARLAISQREIHFEGKRLRVTASVGLAQLSDDSSKQVDSSKQGESSKQADDRQCESLEQWMQRSDDALYHSKEAGRDCGHSMDGQTPMKIELKKAGNSQSKQISQINNPAKAEDALLNQADDKEAKVDKIDESTVGPFASLPNRNTMAQEFVEMQDRAGASVTTFVMAIRCHIEADPSVMRSLLQATRATLRNVDRLGYQDQSTLLVCMPSVDQETARTRGEQIVCSAGSIGLGCKDGEDRTISIGVAEIEAGEHFDQAIGRSITMADQGRDPKCDGVVLETAAETAI
jgi:diguanylate cyclase (GGDEF)-like protein